MNLRHQGLWQMSSGESCWGGAREASCWQPIPSLYQLMEGNVDQCLGHLPHCLLLWAELTLIRVLGTGVGEDPPFCRLVSQAGQPPQGSGVDG